MTASNTPQRALGRIRADVQSMHAYAVQDASGLIKLDAMENPFGLPPALQAALGQRLGALALNRYPGARGADLQRALATHAAMPEGFALMLGNGSDELISLIAMACDLPGAAILAPVPGFVMYAMSAQLQGLRFVGVPLTADFELDQEAMLEAIASEKPAIVYLAYPNNPTANLWDDAVIEKLVEAQGAQGGLVVIDEAYQPFAGRSYIDRVARHGHVLLMRTLSKFGLAGIRLGYLMGTLAQQVAAATFEITNSEFIREENTAFYLQAEAKFLQNRLGVITGVRFEGTESKGEGPVFDPSAVFVRNANGSFARNAQGAQIRKPEAGAAGSLAELALTRKERGNRAGGEYDGYYPSLHLTYNVTPNFLARLAYAQTYGRPNFDSIIPNVSINELNLREDQLDDPNAIPGTVTIRNTNLKPWDADNYDLSLEYYTSRGGVFTGGVFRKDIQGFFVTDARIATEADTAQFGLDPRYAGFTLSTTRNGGDARVTGAEISARHSLGPLAQWARSIEVFVNATKVRPVGDEAANFSGFIPKTVNWGVTYSKRPFLVMAKWNWRSEVRGAVLPATYGPDAYTYTDDRTQLDLNLEYQFHLRITFFFYARNLFDARNVLLRKGSLTAPYAKIFQSADYGAQLSAGIKGSF